MHSPRLELLVRAPAELVVAERGEQRRLAREPRELDRRDRTAAAHLLPVLGGVRDLACSRHALDAREADPLDVPDDGDSHPGRVSQIDAAAR